MIGQSLLNATRVQSRVFASAQKHRDDDRFCRLCHGEEHFSDMVAPCDCTGSMKWAHSTCLDEILKTDTLDGCCSVCNRMFIVVPRNPLIAMGKSYLDLISVYASFVGFPLAWWNKDWSMMIFWVSIPMIGVSLSALLLSIPRVLKISNKVSFAEELFWTLSQGVSAFNVCVLFMLYCSTLRWSVDFQRLWPSAAALLVSETIVFTLGAIVFGVFGPPEELEEDDLHVYCFLIGLGIWSVIRAEPIVPQQYVPGNEGQCPVSTYRSLFL